VDRLDNTVQGYAWGHPSALWDLLGVQPSGPAAELWMGAHPSAPSRLVGRDTTLLDAVAADPVAALGPDGAQAFDGRLPFLFKVLAAGEALSLQAHPDRARARAGFRREDQAGIALDDPRRIYRDESHKPELICAVTPFEARCGFREPAATVAFLEHLDHPGLRPLLDRLSAPGRASALLGDTLGWLLTLPADAAGSLVADLEAAASAATDGPPGPLADERASVRRLAARYPADPGVVAAVLLNHVRLEPGEALFLGAGNLHCYLAGVGVELMANSDNVVRGGLTSKHVDVDELLAVVDASPIEAPVQRPVGPVHAYQSPVPEFALVRHHLDGAVERPASARIVIVLDGDVEIATAAGANLGLTRGQSVWVPWADGPMRLSGRGLVYEATPNGAAVP
jgi:mannose-6-phosphate isomerase